MAEISHDVLRVLLKRMRILEDIHQHQFEQRPVTRAPVDTGTQATIRQRLNSAGMTDQEIDKAIGRVP